MDAPSTRQLPDISRAIRAPFQDPGWLNKSLLLGLFLLIPFIGIPVLMGWARELYDRRLRGEEGLPDLHFGRQLSYGITPVLAGLNLVLVLFAALLALGAASAAVGAVVQSLPSGALSQAGHALFTIAVFGSQLLTLATVLGLQLVLPELLRRGFRGEAGPLFSPAASIAAIRARPAAYITTFIGIMVANFIGASGMFACYVGAVVTMPLGYAITADLLAQWDRLVRGGDGELAGDPPGEAVT